MFSQLLKVVEAPKFGSWWIWRWTLQPEFSNFSNSKAKAVNRIFRLSKKLGTNLYSFYWKNLVQHFPVLFGTRYCYLNTVLSNLLPWFWRRAPRFQYTRNLAGETEYRKIESSVQEALFHRKSSFLSNIFYRIVVNLMQFLPFHSVLAVQLLIINIIIPS